MSGKFNSNYTDKGYLMIYEKGLNIAPFNKWVLQFKIELTEILPLIWRIILVPSDYNFWDLHVAIQDSMGWQDCHLHYFEFKRRKKEIRIGIPDFEGFDESPEILPGWQIPVFNYFKDLGETAKYLYDYGDCWWHTVQLEGYFYKDKKLKYPLCIDGERACPPENCGGVQGYFELIDTLSDPKKDDYEDARAWVGEKWHSDVFDRYAVKFNHPFKRWEKAFF
jgi:hypothetical protein